MNAGKRFLYYLNYTIVNQVRFDKLEIIISSVEFLPEHPTERTEDVMVPLWVRSKGCNLIVIGVFLYKERTNYTAGG